NVKRSTLDRIDLKTNQPHTNATSNTYQVSQMPAGISIIGEGSDYNLSYDPSNSQNGVYIENYGLPNNVKSDKYYVYYHNTSNNNYAYQFIDKPIPTNFTLDYNNFITTGVET